MDCLLFDFGGTLDADGLTWLDRFRPIYKEAGLNLTAERLDRAFYDSDDALPSRYALAGLSLEDTVRLQVGDVLAAVAPERSKDLLAVVAGRFVDDCRAHLRRNRPMLERLSKRWKLGVVSNWYGNMDGILRAEGLGGLFGAVADSGALGTTKPDPKIFLSALAALGGEPRSAVMVGDSIKRDMRGAEGLSMRHVLLSSSPVPCCGQALRIKSLIELEDALEGVTA